MDIYQLGGLGEDFSALAGLFIESLVGQDQTLNLTNLSRTTHFPADDVGVTDVLKRTWPVPWPTPLRPPRSLPTHCLLAGHSWSPGFAELQEVT